MSDDTSRQFGIVRNQLTETPGRRIMVHRDGMWQIEITYECHVDDMVSLMPSPYSRLDEFPFCGVDEVSNIAQEGYVASMMVSYKGLPSATTDPVYELLSTSQQEPMESHSMFKDVTHAEITKINNYISGGTATAPTLSEDAKGLLSRKMRGQTDFLAVGYIWIQTLISNQPLASVDLQTSGFIDSPPGSPPYPPNCNWLFTNASQVREGGVYKITRSWRLSAPGGWDPEIYKVGSTVDDGDDPDDGLGDDGGLGDSGGL